MRVSSTQMIGRYQKQLNDSYEDQAKLMEQSDGSKLHRPSDDSVNYSKFLRYQNTDTENDQFQSNVKNGISWMKTADAAMVNMKDLLTTINEKTIQAATDTNDQSNIAAIGKDVYAKVLELVSLGNTQQGDRFMFAGQSDLEQPFVISSRKEQRGLTKTLDTPQSNFFSEVADGKGNMTQMLEMTGVIRDASGNIVESKTFYLSTLNGKLYSREFMDDGYKSKVAEGQSKVAAGDESGALNATSWVVGTTKVSDYFDKNGVIDPTKTGTIDTVTMSDDGKTYEMSFATIQQYVVEYQGDEKKISMVKRNGTTDPTADTVNVTGQDLFGSDIFDNENSGANYVNGHSGGTAALNDLLQLVAKMEAGDVHWLSADGITVSDRAHVQVIEAETSAAARQNVYDSVSTMLDKQNETITEDISNCSDADVAKLAIDLMTMQTIYNMSLSVGSRILPQSLADYL